jgi:hypothetical protein
MARNSPGMNVSARLIGLLQWRIQHYEHLAISLSDHVLVNSRRDRDYLCHLHGNDAKIHVLENCVPASLMTREWKPNPTRPPTLLFVGNMAYGPNRAGALHFALHILPRVQAQVPETQFVICGQGSSDLAKLLGQSRGVRAVGYVDDLIAMYLTASAMVVPVPVAGGTQYKLLEAMALGVPIIASPQAAQVGEMMHERELLVGDTDVHFAAMATLVLQDPDWAKRLSENGRNFIQSHHLWESKTALLRSIVKPD